MKLIVISRPRYHKGEAAMLNKLMKNYQFVLHLRKPKGKRDQMKKLIAGIDQRYHDRIVLHDHYDLSDEFKLAGVCLNKRSGLEHRNGVARSLHAFSEFNGTSDAVEYVLISPVFDSISKSGYKSVVTNNESFMEELKGFKDKYNVEVCALGGVSESKVQKAHDMGFDGVAVLGFLWRSMQHDDGEDRVNQKLRTLLQKVDACDLVS